MKLEASTELKTETSLICSNECYHRRGSSYNYLKKSFRIKYECEKFKEQNRLLLDKGDDVIVRK